jgi:hypothetical protein
MNITKKTFIALAGCALASVSAGIAPAQAQDANGWNYAIDSFNDGFTAWTTGTNSNYEFYGLAIKETADKVYVGLNSNLKLGGQSAGGAFDGHIHYGDLFFNFTGQDLNGAQGNLFAIKFDEGNDSGFDADKSGDIEGDEVLALGVYGNVTGKNMTAKNSGFTNMAHHYNRAGSNASMGDLNENDAYFQQGNRSVTTSIQSGTFLGGIDKLDGGALAALGLNFQSVDNLVAGKHTFGFSFTRDLMVDGDYVAHLFAECINDGIAIAGSLPHVEIPEVPDAVDVPEPALATGLFLMGGLGLLKGRQKKTATT